MQNLPRSLKIVKQVFVPKLEAFLFFDYDSIELRLLAFYLSAAMGDDDMASQYRSNPEYDPHTETAQMLFKKSVVTPEERQVGKTLNFAIVYGGATPTIMNQLGVSYKEAKSLLDNFHAGRPGIKELSAGLQATLESRGYIKNLYGRRGHVEDGHKALNWLIQGCAADLLKESLVKIDTFLDKYPWHVWKSHMVNCVHDEIIFDCVKSEIPELVQVIPGLMTNPTIDEVVPIRAEPQVSYTNWADKEKYVIRD
jgi:DNA polymerase-1